jgi:omega-amidase
MFNCPYSNSSFPLYAEEINSVGTKLSEIDREKSISSYQMGSVAKELGIHLVSGSIPEIHEGKLYNTSIVFDEMGTIVAKHRKVPLYCIK